MLLAWSFLFLLQTRNDFPQSLSTFPTQHLEVRYPYVDLAKCSLSDNNGEDHDIESHEYH